jgi:adenylate cyclase
MTTPESATSPISFAERLRSGGIEPGDSDELRLNKSLLMLSTGLVCITMMLWVSIYYMLGLNFSRDLPLLVQLLLVGNAVFYIYSRRFDFFRVTQLGLFLFLPFVAQWAAGNLIVSSGVVLWGLLAPIGAILCLGAKESVGWFIAWIVLTALSGGADYYLADALIFQKPVVPVSTSLLFFTLNFIGVAAVGFALLLFFIEQKRKAQERLEQSRKQVRKAQEAADYIFIAPFV